MVLTEGMGPAGTRQAGIVLAAGAGRRMGMPKALVRSADGEPWVARAARVLLDGGCSYVAVVLGARAEEARILVPGDSRVSSVVAERWEDGMSASLREGLLFLGRLDEPLDAAVITLVDLPGLTPAVVTRLSADADEHSLRQATYDGRPGHPVLVGRAHWEPLMQTLRGDEGGRRYLGAHGAERVECGDLADGRDVDTPHEDAPSPGR